MKWRDSRQLRPGVTVFVAPGPPRHTRPAHLHGAPRDGKAATWQAISSAALIAVARAMPAIVVPLAAPHVAALATWRDAVVPVVDFRCEDVLSSRHRRERSLIVRYQGANGGGLLAIAVDPDVALHRATAADRQLTPRSAQPSFVSGVFTVGRCPVALLDVDALA